MLDFAFARGRCSLSTNELRIDQALTARILRANLQRPEVEGDREILNTFRATGTSPIILLGMRVENRTVVDLVDFYINVIRHVLKRRGRVLVAFDGYNAETWFGSLAATEQEIVDDVRKAMVGQPVEVVSTIGAPMARSLFWSAHADFFVTPWGAGMAKYCWICAKPGLVVSSCWNLKNRGDLHIYRDYSERPGALEYLPPEYVTDDPSAPLLADYPNVDRPGSIINFRVDLEGVYPILDRLLERYAPTASEPERQWAG